MSGQAKAAWFQDPANILALPVVGMFGLVVYLAVETLRPGTLMASPDRSMSEAIAVGNPAQALELMSAGADVDAVGHISAGVIDGGEYEATPLEAAILARRIESVGLLLRSGANPFISPRIVCLARLRLPEALPMLGVEAESRDGDVFPPTEAIQACSAGAGQ